VDGADKVLGPNGLEYFNGKLLWPDQQLKSLQFSLLDGSQVTPFAMDENPYDTVGGMNIFFPGLTDSKLLMPRCRMVRDIIDS
jgi:hypothetical protein